MSPTLNELEAWNHTTLAKLAFDLMQENDELLKDRKLLLEELRKQTVAAYKEKIG